MKLLILAVLLFTSCIPIYVEKPPLPDGTLNMKCCQFCAEQGHDFGFITDYENSICTCFNKNYGKGGLDT
jgi:hypothetical protein